MPPYLWPDPATERQRVKAATGEWSRIRQQAGTATFGQAQGVSDMYANYPHMRPGVVVPLAQSGLPPTDPTVTAVAEREAKRNKRKRGWWGALQDLVPNPASVGRLPEAGELLIRNVINPVGRAGVGALKQTTRDLTAAAAFLPELGMGLYRDAAAVGGHLLAGAGAGGATGAAVGLAGGPFAEVTVPVGVTVGAVAGGLAGAVAEIRGQDIESQGIVNPLAQTRLGQQLTGKSPGTGYFAAGEAEQAAVRAQRAAASVNGHALTPGRSLATSVTEPGTRPYSLLSGLVDASITWELDPTAAATKGASRWRAAAQRFDPAQVKQAAGVVDGVRQTTLPEVVDQWLGSKQGSTAVDWLADQTDFETIRRQLGPGKVDVATVLDLTNARTADEVAAVLRPRLGLARGLEQKPRIGGFGAEVTRRYGGKFRLLQDLPTGRIDFSDPTEAVHQFDLLQADANVAREIRAVNNRKMAEALLPKTPEGRLQARKLVRSEFLGRIGDQADEIAGSTIRKLDRQIAKDEERIYRGLVNEDGTRTAVKAVSWGGKTTGLSPAGQLSDYLDMGIEIDRKALRDIRAATSRWAPLFANSKVQIGVSAAEYLTNDVWKPVALLRGAWTVRVIGEEQVRMAAAGRMSMFNHPLSYLAWAVDDDTRIAAVLKKARLKTGRGQVGVTGERFARKGATLISEAADDALEMELRGIADDYQAAIGVRQQAEGYHTGGTMVRAKHQVTYTPDQDRYYEAWAETIDKLHGDPLVRELARTGDVQGARAWFTPGGEGDEIRQALVRRGAPLERSVDVDAHISAAQRNLLEASGGTQVTAFEQVLPGLGEGVVRAGDVSVMQAVATGNLGGIPLRDARGNINPQFVSQLRRIGVEGPAEVAGMAYERSHDTFLAAKDDAIQKAFGFFMAKPSARLSRSPMFRQSYWSEAESVIWQMGEGDKVTLLDNARKAKLPQEQIKRLEAASKKGTGELTLEHADVVLKGRALDQTRDLLYEASQRGQLADVLRIIFPFLEAQKEVMATWAKIGTQTPQAGRRAQQLIQGTRQAGWFWTDEQTGEEMFTFPGSDILTEHWLGVKVPLAGRVQGLNMFGSGIMPGIGPAVQMPVRWLIPDKPQYDELREFLDPFGTVAGEEQGIIEQNLPSWLTKIRTGLSADEGDRLFANTVKDVWATGMSSGKYSADTPEDIRAGLEDAKSAAKVLYLIRGAAQFLGAPTSPTPRMMAMDPQGKWIVADKLAADFKAMAEDPEIGWQNASRVFLEKYGNNAAAFIQSKTYSTVAQAATSVDASQWLRANPTVAERYADVAGLFAPQGEEFDYTQYLRNIAAGTTINLTPEQYVRAANDRIGKMVYYAQKDRIGPSPSQPQRQWLSQLRDVLREAYPGFDEQLPGKPDQDTVKREFIPQIIQAVADPALRDNDVATATRVYLRAREQAQAAAEASGYQGFQQAKAMEATRDWLRRVGDALQRAVPDFAPMWERVFDREMAQDVPTETAQAAEATTR